MNNKILRIDDVCELVALSRSTIYRLMKSNEFPNKIQLSKRSVGFRLQDVLQWIENK